MRHWIIIAAAVLLANGSAHAAQPDVLFVVADDLNMMIGCYGHPLAKTPNMDRLAERGVRFEQAYCQDPVCNPSRTSFLSGRRPGDKLKDVAWLPDHFRAQGYEVIEVGKVAHSYGISRTAIRWSANEKGGVPRAIELLEARRDKPLFLAVGLAHTHDSVATSEFRKLYDPDKVSWPKEPDDLHQRFPDAAFRGVKEASMSAAERRETVARYLASVSTLDAELGKLLEVLERRKLWENTIVVFTSDHGKHKGEHGIWDKRSLFEVSVQVPLLVAAPGKKPGQVSPRLVELVDLYPTLTELCGIAAPPGLQGSSFVPLLADAKRPWKKAAFTFARASGGWSVRTERYRYSQWQDGSAVLTDLDKDPHEHRNLVDSADHRQVVEEMRALLKAGWREALPTTTSPR